MKDERFDREEVEQVRADAARGDATEEERLITLGRRVEALLASEDPPDGLSRRVGNSRDAWDWFRSALEEK